MYAIKWKRCTGEEGTFDQRFRTEQKANEAISRMNCLDRMKGRKNEYEYEIIEIGNSAEITK